MSRLRHSESGYLRKMQISTTQIFIFVEGQLDRCVYDRLCGDELSGTGVRYSVVEAVELPGATGGKARLLSLYDYLRRRRRLTSKLGRNRTEAIFFLDKDVDDYLRMRRISGHVVYTRDYQIENHILQTPKLLEALANAALIQLSSLRRRVTGRHILRRLADTWKGWVVLCLFSERYRVRGVYSFGSTSRIHDATGALCSSMWQQAISTLQSRSGLPQSEFDARLDEVRLFAERKYARSQYHRIFKGKWFFYLLRTHLQDALTGITINFNGFEERLIGNLLGSLDTHSSWAIPFREGLRHRLDSIQRGETG